MEDVEGGVVARVIGVFVQRTRGVHGVRIGVDVEVALHGARYGVRSAGKRSRRFLFTVGRIRDQVEGEVVQNVIGRVEVGRVARNLAGLRPSRVVQGAQRSVVGRFLGSGSEAHRVAVHDIVVEQRLEPVRIAVFGRTQIACDRFGRILHQGGGDQVVHPAVNAALGTVGRFGEVQPALFAHLFVNGHLILRIHDVEFVVRGDHAVGELTGVVDAADACTAFLGGDDDDARHGACAVDRGGGTVFEDVETFDILGIQACDGRRDQCRGVARRERIGVDVHHVFHNDAVDDPQRFRASEDRRGTADADLGCGTECTGNILDGDAGRTAFEAAADVGHAGKFHVIGDELVGCPGEEALVRLGHTRDHDCFHGLGIGFELYTDIGGDGYCPGLITHIGNL